MRGLMVYSAASKSENVQGELILNLVYCAKLYYQKVYININDNNDITIIIVVIRKFVCDSNYPFLQNYRYMTVLLLLGWVSY